MKEPYEKRHLDYGICYFEKIHLTGRCKKVTGGPGLKATQRYYEVKRFFGLYTTWVNSNDIHWFDPVKVEYYDCECGK